jgi:hypothetical protein
LSLEGTNILNKYYWTNGAGNGPASDPAQAEAVFLGLPRVFELSVRRNLK